MASSGMIEAESLQWWAGAAAVLLAALTLWYYRALRTRTSTRAALLIAMLRCVALALAVVLVAGPRVVKRTLNPARSPILVGIDVSRSMGIRGGLEQSRLDRVRDFLQSAAYRRAVAGRAPALFSFSSSLAPLAGDEVSSLVPDGPRTDLAAVLSETAATGAGAAAAVIFTDGGHGAGERASSLAGLPGLPLIFVGVGAGERTVDAEITSVAPPAVAFAGQPLQIPVVVRASGLAGRSVPLLLKRGEQVLASRTVLLPPDGQEAQAVLEWTPPAPGAHPLVVQVPEQSDEQIVENNRVDLPVEAVRDKIRVLLVSGSPSWSYRFLRAALKGDPSIDVVSFIILRSPADAVDVPQQELSLIPFPTQKIFLEELHNFDLLVFDNFASQPYLPSAYLAKVEEFVRGGGGFWMLGGPQSYLGGRYQQSAIAGMLPVALPDPPPPGATFHDQPVRPRLTPAGRRHPFFQGLVVTDPAPPPLRGFNVTGPARPGAVVLAEAELPGAKAQPLVVLGRHGRGRVLSVLTDSLWEWAFAEVGRGRGNRAYLAFVRQAVRWSIGDPQLEPLRVEPERPRLAPGDPIRARVRVLGEDYLPASRSGITVTLRSPGGGTRALVATPEGPGTYRVEAGAAGEGSWEIVAEASASGAAYARAAATVAVAWPPEEYRSPGLNRPALASLLDGRRGALVELGDVKATATSLEKALAELAPAAPNERAETRPLAETSAVFLALLCLLAAEWVARRRAGLD